MTFSLAYDEAILKSLCLVSPHPKLGLFSKLSLNEKRWHDQSWSWSWSSPSSSPLSLDRLSAGILRNGVSTRMVKSHNGLIRHSHICRLQGSVIKKFFVSIIARRQWKMILAHSLCRRLGKPLFAHYLAKKYPNVAWLRLLRVVITPSLASESIGR